MNSCIKSCFAIVLHIVLCCINLLPGTQRMLVPASFCDAKTAHCCSIQSTIRSVHQANQKSLICSEETTEYILRVRVVFGVLDVLGVLDDSVTPNTPRSPKTPRTPTTPGTPKTPRTPKTLRTPKTNLTPTPNPNGKGKNL